MGIAFNENAGKTRARIGRGTLRPTPKCNDLPPPPVAGEYTAWLIAIVEPGGEERARAWLWHQSKVRTWLPRQRTFRHRGVRRTRVPSMQPMVCGYLLVPAIYVDHASVLMAPGIHNYLAHGERLVVVPDCEFKTLREIELGAVLGHINAVTGKRYTEGDLVRIGNGEVLAAIERIDESGRACLWAGSIRIKTDIGRLDPA